MKPDVREALKKWEEFHRSLLAELSVDTSETAIEKRLRIRRLEADPEAWFMYYFPQYCTAPAARFHKALTRRILKHKRYWLMKVHSRELAKSTRTMMEVLYLALVPKESRNIIMVSNSYDNAERLLAPYKINLESNTRITNDYGKQQRLGNWESGEFITNNGVSFRALGAGQSPRGTKNEALRVDTILIDDIDTDQDCRNERIIRERVKWIQEALIPTVSISGNYRIIMCGNRIAKICCVTLCEELANYVSVVNIRDEHGRSSWPEKNSEAHIDDILRMLSYASQQKEYFNNPLIEGTVFKEMAYKPARHVADYKFLVCYTDPSFKDSKKNDFKATVLVGRYMDEFHVIKAYVEQTSTAQMIAWHYEIDNFIGGRVAVYYVMEANFLQDTILREFYQAGRDMKKLIPITGDLRSKPDKYTRIEAMLEPLNRNGKLWLNETEIHTKGMKTLEEQFLAFAPGSAAHDDGPDAVEGAVFLLNLKWGLIEFEKMKVITKTRSKKRF